MSRLEKRQCARRGVERGTCCRFDPDKRERHDLTTIVPFFVGDEVGVHTYSDPVVVVVVVVLGSFVRWFVRRERTRSPWMLP